MVPVAGLEPAPSSISGWRLYQLGYTGVFGERKVLPLLADPIAVDLLWATQLRGYPNIWLPNICVPWQASNLQPPG
jgi:hypothetical protein